jgi:competence protein ComEC
MQGKIAEDTVQGRRGDTQIVVQNISINAQEIPGTIWVSTPSKVTLKRSDTITVYGVIKEGFGAFNASMTGATIRNIAQGSDTARDARDWFAERVRHGVKEPEASLGIGFLVGQRSSLPEDVDTALRVAGLTHIVVASGYNVTVLLRLSRRLFEKISKYLTAVSGGLLITGFILVTGVSPSMSRAGLVAGLSLAAWYYGRTFNPFILLSCVAGISVLINPMYIWGDVGWYLSFAAFAGVMIIAPLLHHYFFGPNKATFFRQILFETLSALIMTIPIILLIFQQYSTFALIANLLVVPLIPIVMLLVFIAGMIPALGFIAEISLRYITGVVNWITLLPNASGTASINDWFIVIWYGSVIVCGWYMWHTTKHDFHQDNLVE